MASRLRRLLPAADVELSEVFLAAAPDSARYVLRVLGRHRDANDIISRLKLHDTLAAKEVVVFSEQSL
jgi:hypothetical protein